MAELTAKNAQLPRALRAVRRARSAGTTVRSAREQRTSLGALVASVAIASAGHVACAPAISTDREVQMGLQAAEQLEQELPVLEDEAVTRYVAGLGHRMLQGVETRDVPWQFQVVNTSMVNAFALPGGFIYVTRGLIEEAQTMSELAGPLGHEIAHVIHRHGLEQLTRMQRAELGANLAYVLLGREPGAVEQVGLQLGAGAMFATYSRDAEREADDTALELLARAGIDPAGMTRFFETLAAGSERRPGAIERWFATHPMTDERIARTREAIAEMPPRDYQVDDEQFRLVKERLQAIPRPRERTGDGARAARAAR